MSNKLEIDDILIVELSEFISLSDHFHMNIILVNNENISKMITLDNIVNIDKYKDYTIGILLDNGFIPPGTSLSLHGTSSPKKGCTFKIKRRKKKDYPIMTDDIRICRLDRRSTSNILKPIKMLAKVVTIDETKKFMDISIADFYRLSKTY